MGPERINNQFHRATFLETLPGAMDGECWSPAFWSPDVSLVFLQIWPLYAKKKEEILIHILIQYLRKIIIEQKETRHEQDMKCQK